jgi:hypothetical protein
MKGFFMFESNDVFHSVQGTSLLSSTIYHRSNRYKGLGEYIHPTSVRDHICFFSVRSLVKSNWINSNDVYIKEDSLCFTGLKTTTII